MPPMLSVTTPLEENVPRLVGLSGEEALSALFRFELDLLAANDVEVPFDRLLGEVMTAHIRAPLHLIC